MKSVSIDGLSISYLERERLTKDISKPDEKKTLLFLHGNSHSKKSFQKQLASTLFEDYRLISMDLPGHGESSPAKEYSLVFYARILTAFAQALELKNVIIAAHSLGGHVAINALSSMNPAGLFLFGTPAIKKPFDPESFLPNPNAQALMQAESSEAEIESLMTELKYTGADKEESMADYRRTDPMARVGVFSNVLSNAHNDETLLLGDYSGELMFLLTTSEGIVNNQYITMVKENLKRISMLTTIQSGHSPHIESPESFNEALANFCTHVEESFGPLEFIPTTPSYTYSSSYREQHP